MDLEAYEDIAPVDCELIEESLDDLSDCADPSLAATLHGSLFDRFHSLAQTVIVETGDIAQGIEPFEIAIEHGIQSITTRRAEVEIDRTNDWWRTLPVECWDVLFLSLVAQDQSLQEQIAEETLAIPDEHVEVFPDNAPKFYYAKTLAATIIDHDDAEMYLQKTRKSLQDHDQFDTIGQTGMFDALAGIIEGDRTAISDGVARHPESFGEYLHDGEINIRVIGMVLLARKYGYEIVVPDDPHIPIELLEDADDR